MQPGGARLDSKISAFRKNEYIGRKREDDGSPSLRVRIASTKIERVWPRHRRQDVDIAVRLKEPARSKIVSRSSISVSST